MELALCEKLSTNSFWKLKMHKTLSLILILFLNFGVLSASTDNITSESDMNVFNSGETISSSKMNENFEILKLSKLELVNLVNELREKDYLIEKPSTGISLDIPLNLLENIFDFWLDVYKNQEAWETCLGLLKIRKRISLNNLIQSDTLKGNSKKWAVEVETLHNYVPNSLKLEKINDPMWK